MYMYIYIYIALAYAALTFAPRRRSLPLEVPIRCERSVAGMCCYSNDMRDLRLPDYLTRLFMQCGSIDCRTLACNMIR